VPNNNDAIKHHTFSIAGDEEELEGWRTHIKVGSGWWTKKSSVSVLKRRAESGSMSGSASSSALMNR
jgi:hypothetical protein